MVSIDDVKDGDGNLSKEEFIDMVAKHPKDDVTFDFFFGWASVNHLKWLENNQASGWNSIGNNMLWF